MKGVSLVAAGTSLAGCGWDDSSWNQKLTVTVDTPQGPVSGSSVTYVEWSENKIFRDGARWQLDYKGEAVVVNLGSRKYLLALLNNGKDLELIGKMGIASLGLKYRQGNEFKRHEGPITIRKDLYPLLVTFGDLNDPKSVKEVKPNNLAASFGAGYGLGSLTLEVTGESVTVGEVERVLPWISSWPGAFVASVMKPADEYTFAERTTVAQFSWGSKD